MPDIREFSVGTLVSPLLVIDQTVTGGAIAKLDGRVIFLDQGLIGDVVSAEVISVKKRIIEAKVSEVLSVSPHAERAWCPHFGTCGGCVWQNFAYGASLDWKKRHISETLSRIGRVDEVDVTDVIPSPELQGFRNKLSFAFGSIGDQTVVGLRQRFSREIIEVTNCGLQPPATMDILHFVREYLHEFPIPAYEGKEGYLRFFVVRHPDLPIDGTRPYYLEVITSPTDNITKQYKEKVQDLMEKLLASSFPIRGIIHSERKNIAPIAEGEKLVSSVGETSYSEEINGVKLSLPIGAFLQTNTKAASLLYTAIGELAHISSSDTVWDIYCGAGGIGLCTALKAKQLVGFDIQEKAIVAARKNALRLGATSARFYFGNLAQTLSKEKEQPDIIILDPPRSGVAPDVLALLATTTAKRIIYVSCDVATQARDIARLSSSWKPIKACPVDMFPYTPHVENILLLERRS